MIDNERLDRFFSMYSKHLTIAKAKHPEDYYWPDGATVQTVVDRMRASVVRFGSFGGINKDSHGFKWNCKELKIPHTYKAMNAFLSGTDLAEI